MFGNHLFSENMGDMQRLQRINQKITRVNNWLIEYKEDRQDLTRKMHNLVGMEFLEAFEELGQLDNEIEKLKREKIRLEALRDYIE